MAYKSPALTYFEWQQPVIDKDLVDPPGGETKGDRYLIDGVGINAWAGEDGNIATYNGAGWDFTDKKDGMQTYVEDEELIYIYIGEWLRFGLNWATKTTVAWSKSIGATGDYADWATMIAYMPNLIAHAVTVTIETGTTLTELCTISNKQGIVPGAAITVQAEKYYPTTGVTLPTADSATATTLRDAVLAAEAFGNDYFNGCWILIVHGTGTDNDFVPITDYVDATGDVVVANWPGTRPDATSRYIIIGALIDGEAARTCASAENCTATVNWRGVGFTNSSWANLVSAYNLNFTAYYCAITKAPYVGLYAESGLRCALYYSGIVDNNTTNTAGANGGIVMSGISSGEVGWCGISDNKQRGIYVANVAFVLNQWNFGDNNGAWGTYAILGGQTGPFTGSECSGAAGNHSDPGTAGNASADQAACY